MRIVIDTLWGEELGRRIELNKSERATLLRAASVAKEMRELARTVDPLYEDTDWDTLIAEVEHNAREIVTEEIPV